MSVATGSTSKDALKLLLLQALAEPIGLVVTTSDRERARQKLYAMRSEMAKAGEEGLDTLQIRFAPDDPQGLWIVKSKIEGVAQA